LEVIGSFKIKIWKLLEVSKLKFGCYWKLKVENRSGSYWKLEVKI